MGWKFWNTGDDTTDAERGTSFHMTVEDVFTITGRGTAVTGAIAAGDVRRGQKILFADASGQPRSTTVTGIEMARALRQEAHAGDKVGLFLKGVTKADVAAGAELWA